MVPELLNIVHYNPVVTKGDDQALNPKIPERSVYSLKTSKNGDRRYCEGSLHLRISLPSH